MQDAYTISRAAIRIRRRARGGINYIRNSVKVTDRRLSRHDALLPDRHEGSDRADHRRSLSRRCSGRSTEMPEDMRTRLRYPEGIFALQAAMFATYHMTNPAVVLQQGGPVGDADDRAAAAASRAPMQPYYTIMRLPGETGAEFIQMLPFTPRQQGQPGVLDGRAQRRRELRAAGGVPVPEAEGDVRAAPDRRAHQPGSGDRAADHAVEPAGLGSDPGHAAGHPDRGVARSTSGRSTCARPAAGFPS